MTMGNDFKEMSLALDTLAQTAAAIAKLRVGDRVRFKPGSPLFRRGLRSGTITAIAPVGETVQRIADKLGVPLADLQALFQKTGLDVTGPAQHLVLPAVELDPCRAILIPGFEIIVEPGQFDLIPEAAPAN